MASGLITLALHIGVLILGAFLFCLFARKNFKIKWFLIAIFVFVIYDIFLTRFYGAIPEVLGQRWNWTGKLMSFGLMLGIAALPIFGWQKVGLTFKQNKGSWPAWALLGVLSAVIFYFAITTGDGPSDRETIAFQWTMPGLDEELFYRGVLLLALNEAFSGKRNILWAPIGYGGLLTCILFGVIHTLAWKNGAVQFDLMTFAMTGIPSFILLWMREKTGSLLTPILAHNVANGAFNLF